MPTLGTIQAFRADHALHSLCSGGYCSTVTFAQGELTPDEIEYARLVAHTNFFQLVRTAVYMNEGLTFREATIKYLKNSKS